MFMVCFISFKPFISCKFILFCASIVLSQVSKSIQDESTLLPNNSTFVPPPPDEELIKKRILSYFKCKDDISAYSSEGEECEPKFDDFACWPATKAGIIVKLNCSDIGLKSKYIEGGSAKLNCSDDGKWVVDEDKNVVYQDCEFNDDKLSTELVYDNINKINGAKYDNPENDKAYFRCVLDVILQPKLDDDGKKYCPRVFDGWGCWNDTLEGTTAYLKCPLFVPGFVETQNAHKVCDKNGTWSTHPETGDPWSNYTTCVDHDDLLFRQRINKLYVSGYSISLINLVISTFIFFYFRSLNCTRITIHKNFFLSFIINNILWIIWYVEVVAETNVLFKNGVGCKVLHVILHYFLLSNYMWMFCEGLYLHTILVITFIREDLMIPLLYAIGWGLPVIFIIIYTILRAGDLDSDAYCWIDPSKYKWVLIGPVCLSLLLNLAFLVNIVRLVVTKVRSVNNPDYNHSRKAVRATIILIPLLGLNYILTPFRPETKTTGEKVYEVISAVATSFQGLCVSLLFCFFNSEVIQAIQRKWNQKQLMYSGAYRMSYPNTTVTLSTNYDIRRSTRLSSQTGPSPTEEYDIS